ncbi:MAG: glucose 1-dehydrogenase [Treponema sp.]|nr:glucose 1-dehydrogenase [Treponema sp.]MEE3435003.1 glucose 1-dehydrogenase [Treponema sp.]
MNRFEDKVVVVTGGTSGIGSEVARQFCEAGAHVIITGRNEENARKVIDSISGKYKIEFERVEMTDLLKIETFAKKIKETYGGADILFNNTGIYPGFNKFEDSSIEEWKNVIDVNVYAIVETAKKFINQLKEKQGILINNASIAGLQDFTSGSGYAYAASKSAIIKFTKMLAKNYAKQVRINCVCPGVIDTPLYLNLDKKKMEERIPAGRVGNPEDIASVVLFLASDAAKYIYGAVLPIDGGITL